MSLWILSKNDCYFCWFSYSLYFLSTFMALCRISLGTKVVTYLMSLGRQCLPIPSLASGMSTFHLVLQAFLSSSKLMSSFEAIILSSSAKAICRKRCEFSVILHISAVSCNLQRNFLMFSMTLYYYKFQPILSTSLNHKPNLKRFSTWINFFYHHPISGSAP